MRSTEFCYWLQGLFEVAEPDTLNAKQVDLIRRHLNMVFLHEIDASYPAEQQEALNAAHSGEKPKLKIGGVDPVTGHVMRC
jgi:hypothetical protein